MISLVHTPWPRDARYLQIGDLLVDLHCRRVLRAGAEIELPQRIFDLMLLLLAEPHALHSRSELFERLWPGVIVEDANLSQSVWLLRRALGEGCKDWIRTVPGAGYVFEPPSPVESFIDRPVAAPSANVTNAEGASKASAPPPSDELAMPAPRMDNGTQPERSGWLRSWGGWSVAAALVISLTLGVASYDKRPDKLAPAEVVPLNVAVIEVGDPANDLHWPVALLRDWLAWKLGSLPEVTLLTESDLAADTSATAPIVVFLSSGSDPENPDDIVVRARFQQAAGEQRIEMRGAADEVPVMADKLSREIVKRLSPGRTEPWPAMELNAAAARRYANVAAAVERRDWITAATLSDEVVKLAPRFGLVRLQQARARSALAQAPEAIDSMDKARTLLLPAPADVTALLDAQRLALNPDPRSQQEAVAAYAALVARHPGNSSMALKHAALLIQTLDAGQALKLLTSHRWDREATGVRIQRLLVLTAAYRAQGDTERAVQSAHTAERLAHAAGKGWNLKRAEALLQMAVLDRGPDQERRVALFKQAAALFDDSGNRTAALYARFQAEAYNAPTPGNERRLGTLLSQARAGGYRSLELAILMTASMQYLRAGDVDNYLAYMTKALAVAETSGDIARRNVLELALVYEDLMRLRYASAHARIERLKSEGLEGHPASLLRRLEADLKTARGEYARSRNILREGERQLAALQSGADRVTQAQLELACAAVENDLALGDLAGARADGKRCAASADPAFSIYALLASANTELLAGDMTTAREQLERARAAVLTMPDEPDRWSDTIRVASLLTRTGDAIGSDRLYNDVLPKLRRWGYSLLIAQAEIGLAENAAARGDWANASEHVAAARRGLPTDNWTLRYRLDVVDVAAASSKGDAARAASIATQTHVRAHQLGDLVAQMEIHTLMPASSFPECGLASREAIIARSGMRGATTDWLKPSVDGAVASRK